MFKGLLQRFFGSSNERMLKAFRQQLTAIASFEAVLGALSDERLQSKTLEFRSRLDRGETLDDLLPEAFAVVREAARRVLGMRHFDVQMLGGMVLHNGMIAEMRTGEGKTLVATLPVYLNALTGKGVHVITVNDYLAQRDSEHMGRLYRFLGLSVGCIINDLSDEDRKEAYESDITYGTNNEFGFDYLRDHMKFHAGDLVQRPFGFAIVDEVDSILIDEARTPLIISGPVEDSSDLYAQVNTLIPQLQDKIHYEKDEKHKQVTLTEEGSHEIERLLLQANLIKEGGLYDYQNLSLVHYVNQSLKAHVIFQRNVDYIVKDKKVIIIDEFTGRMMEGRRYSEGLHQALEAKEHATIQMENQTLASITFQNYFRLYPKLAGMTGTAHTEAEEFADIYKLHVVQVPTHRAVARQDHDDEVYRTSAEKIRAVVKLIEECRVRLQPVLVGTISIEKSEELSDILKQKKIPHQVLNARYHEQEADIIADAGRPGAVTIATNMAGRGTDIKLGGNLDRRIAQAIQGLTDTQLIQERIDSLEEEWRSQEELAKKAGGLFVIGTERHESRRIDNQLRGRSGRQGDPGASRFFVSLEDDLMRIFGSERLDSMLVKLGLQEDEALVHPWINKALAKAQHKVEARNYDMRKQVIKFDDVMNDQRKVIYEQRHEFMSRSNLQDLIHEMVEEVIDRMVGESIPQGSYAEMWDVADIEQEAHKILGVDLSLASWIQEDAGITADAVKQRLNQAVKDRLSQKESFYGVNMMRHIEKITLLRFLDQVWKNHLLALDHVRQGINLRSYGQRDPLHEYKDEAFSLFHQMLDHLKMLVVQSLCHVEVNLSKVLPSGEVDDEAMEDLLAEQMGLVKKTGPVPLEAWSNIPRNALCPCGSEKKYKYCHGKLN